MRKKPASAQLEDRRHSSQEERQAFATLKEGDQVKRSKEKELVERRLRTLTDEAEFWAKKELYP